MSYRSLACVSSLCLHALAADAKISGQSVAFLRYVMKLALNTFGGQATPDHVRKTPLQYADHAELVRHLVGSPFWQNTYGLSSKSNLIRSTRTVRYGQIMEDTDVTLGPKKRAFLNFATVMSNLKVPGASCFRVIPHLKRRMIPTLPKTAKG